MRIERYNTIKRNFRIMHAGIFSRSLPKQFIDAVASMRLGMVTSAVVVAIEIKIFTILKKKMLIISP